MIITFISDTHTKHNQITGDLPGGDLIIHAGDISSMGYKHEIQQFLKWFNGLDNYTNKVFIAGNHDWGFQDNPYQCQDLLYFYDAVVYLEDKFHLFDEVVKIWGSPWQPEFHNWAFNLPKNGTDLEEKWNLIPNDTDILITHGPAWGYLDKVIGQYENLGCQLLTKRIEAIAPKIHVCGHIHTGYGYLFNGKTHFINAAVLDEQYKYTQKPLTVDWDPETNEMNFL